MHIYKYLKVYILYFSLNTNYGIEIDSWCIYIIITTTNQHLVEKINGAL